MSPVLAKNHRYRNIAHRFDQVLVSRDLEAGWVTPVIDVESVEIDPFGGLAGRHEPHRLPPVHLVRRRAGADRDWPTTALLQEKFRVSDSGTVESGEFCGGCRVDVLGDGVAEDVWVICGLRDEDQVLADFAGAVEGLEIDFGRAGVSFEGYVCEEVEEDVDSCFVEELEGLVGGLGDVCVIDEDCVDAELAQVGDIFA
jgi:hypothetical protein